MYDFGTESSRVELSKASLLLSYWCQGFSGGQPSSTWLTSAIHHAKHTDAHLQAALPVVSRSLRPALWKRQNALRRLWWCCIVQDRLLALSFGTCLRITSLDFEVKECTRLKSFDLEENAASSNTYSNPTRKANANVFIQLTELCCVLTDLIEIVFRRQAVPSDEVSSWSHKLCECEVSLKQWLSDATVQCPGLENNCTLNQVSDPSKSRLARSTNL